jgi:hypothetical protein
MPSTHKELIMDKARQEEIIKALQEKHASGSCPRCSNLEFEVIGESMITLTPGGGQRWYFDHDKRPPGLPVYIARPAITWVGSYWYKGPAYWRYIAEKNGWAEVEKLLDEASARGTKVHAAIESMFLKNPEVGFTNKFLNTNTGQEEELSMDEFGSVESFVDFWETEILAKYQNVKVLMVERSLTSKGGTGYERGFGCTVDLVLEGELEGKRKILIIDHKTSQNIYSSADVQLSGIKRALIEEGSISGIEDAELYILQLGYKKNKVKKYKFTQHEYRFDMVLTSYAMWREENKKAQPEQKEFPISLKLNFDGVLAPDGTPYINSLVPVIAPVAEATEVKPEPANEDGRSIKV